MSDFYLNQLLELSNKNSFRTIFLISGSNVLHEIAKIHYLLSKYTSKNKNNILWVYNDHNSFEKLKKSKKNILVREFFENSQVRYLYYKDSKKILGNSFRICILQDLKAITPNIFLRIVETIEGGGVIILISDHLEKQKHFNLEDNYININTKSKIYLNLLGRFIENFLYALKNCPVFFFIDSDYIKFDLYKSKISLLNKGIESANTSKKNLYIKLVDSISNVQPINNLIKKTKTFDQARAFLSLTESIADKNKYSRIIMTSGRGRGKSSVLGLACCSAIAYGFSNIFITSTTVENVNTFYAFLILGLETIGLKENKDFEIIFNKRKKCIHKVNIFNTHKQFIKFVKPEEINEKKDFIELLIIEESATFQFEILKTFTGPFITIFSTTYEGYEGSGRSFNVKFLDWIKKDINLENKTRYINKIIYYKEIILSEPIRYSTDDYLEKWINDYFFFKELFPLNTLNLCPDPFSCKLYLVDRNSLFSNHKLSRKILHKIVNIFFFSHYKNSPDDLQLMCDSPFHRIFVLIHQKDISLSLIPDILAAVQISYEGQISKNYAEKKFQYQFSENGDLIPWIISKYYFNFNFAELSGIRIVRIGVHSGIQNLGFGSRIIQQLEEFCKKKHAHNYEVNKFYSKHSQEKKIVQFYPSLFIDLKSRITPEVDYIGVSFNLNSRLFFFWNKNKFKTILIKKNRDLYFTKYSFIMIRDLKVNKININWFLNIQKKFVRNFVNLIDTEFKDLELKVIFYMINDFLINRYKDKSFCFFNNQLLSYYELKKIKMFITKKNLDFDYIGYIFKKISKILLFKNLTVNKLKISEILILIGLGMQKKKINSISRELEMRKDHIFLLIHKILKKFLIYVNY
ncbi:hypothetical protein (nucleomorph) [Guillardia theta]|uniref:N-acetyltransferase domain-containing protein n=1 Tax=Guillardia theta TaxID=55529 RepID=Q98RW2_GUITH|nr:hypothetical protein GTHECHR1046 [Guillardia theta]AAK39838.1 hypothetical protein [Guillardia theta]|mmetsp:Transcript_37597/g.118700  ORF Transcript_37597/g.118700 Transcript_37597/m.118700 type:complete len:860 (-) Transcript_37597:2507-5086(-)